MLISIACLHGDYNEFPSVKLDGIIKDLEVNSFNDVLRHLANIYAHPQNPYPIIGNVKATEKGLLIPNIGNRFFWFYVQDNYTNIILDDFGSGKGVINSLNTICHNSLFRMASIWEYNNSWSRTHHKTSSERLISYYVNYVINNTEKEKYTDWLGATGEFFVDLSDPEKNERFYVNIDMRLVDNSNHLKGILEAKLINHINKYDQETQKEVRHIVEQFMFTKHLDEATNVATTTNKNSSGFPLSKVESLSKDLISSYNKTKKIFAKNKK